MTEWHPLRSVDHDGSSTWQQLNKDAEIRARRQDPASLPSLDHVGMKDFELVYEPSEDTYLLLDSIKYDFSRNTELKNSTKQVLEIGCGTGTPVVFLGKLLKPSEESMTEATQLFATDINPEALRVTRETAVQNGIRQIETIQCDLASALIPRFEGRMDVIIFNPPYVPTPDSEVSGNGIEASWAGGLNGRRVVDRCISQIAKLLASPDGVCYLITVDDNEPEELAERFCEVGLTMVPLLRRRARNEYLTVQKLTWTKNNNVVHKK